MESDAILREPLHLPSTMQGIPSGWSWARLDEICSGVFDCPHSTPQLSDVGPLMVRSQDIRSGVFRTKEAARVSEKTYHERTARAEPTFGDLLYSREGTYFGIAAEVPPGVRVCLGQRMVLIRPNPEQVDFRYLRYWLNSSILAPHIYGQRDGTVAERLNLPVIRGLPVPLPPLPKQQNIAQILGTLDDKIELNHSMNETLEAIARALFKAWFVDFDPVRAKAAGRQPLGMDAETAALFPDRFEESALGEIPRGWRIVTVGEVAIRVTKGTTPTTIGGQFVERGINFVKVESITDDGRIETSKLAHIDERTNGLLSRSVLKQDDILFTIAGTIGRVALVSTRILPANTNQAVAIVRANAEVALPRFLYYVLGDKNHVQQAHSRIVQSVQANFSLSELSSLKFLLPPLSVQHAIVHILGTLIDRIELNYRINETLSTIRNALLPKLLSGEIRVKEAEKLVEAKI